MVDFQTLVEMTAYIVGIMGGMGGGMMAIYHKIYGKGKKDAIDKTCAQRIEQNLKTLTSTIDENEKHTSEGMRQLNKRLDKSDQAVIAQIEKLHVKVDDAKDQINERFINVTKELSDLGGQFKNHINTKQDNS